MAERFGTFAADLAALFRDPAGVTELRGAFPSDDDSTLSAAVFLQRCAARAEQTTLDPEVPRSPGNLIAAARWIGLTAMAEPWLGAVRTWHDTQAAARDAAISSAVEQELYWRLAGGGLPSAEQLITHLEAWPIAGAPAAALAALGAALCEDGTFRYSFEGVAARVAEIGERVALGQLVIRMTVSGTPLVVPEDATGEAWLKLDRGDRSDSGSTSVATEPTTPRGALLGRLLSLRSRGPELFRLPLRPLETAAASTSEDRVCCFLRGDQLLVAVAVGDRATGACGWRLPDEAAGTWRDELTGRVFELPDRASLAGILGPDGRAVLTRTGAHR